MDNLYPKCTLCGETPERGLRDGFRLAGKLICTSCENEIISTSIGSAKYGLHIHQIKKVLFLSS